MHNQQRHFGISIHRSEGAIFCIASHGMVLPWLGQSTTAMHIHVLFSPY